MAVGAVYLTKMYRAVRIKNVTSDISAELTDLVEECRRDLEQLGVSSTKTTDETDVLILGAVRSFVRWKMAANEVEAIQNMNDYFQQRDELRRRRDYAYLTITFTVKTAGAVAIPDAIVTFNGESIYTSSTGVATFYYVSPEQNQQYTVTADGYISQAVDLDVTISAAVSVTMVAA